MGVMALEQRRYYFPVLRHAEFIETQIKVMTKKKKKKDSKRLNMQPFLFRVWMQISSRKVWWVQKKKTTVMRCRYSDSTVNRNTERWVLITALGIVSVNEETHCMSRYWPYTVWWLLYISCVFLSALLHFSFWLKIKINK